MNKRVLTLLPCLMALSLSLSSRVVQTYHVTEPGSLAVMMGESWQGIDSLVVTGEINDDDVAMMRRCVYQGVTTGINLHDASLPGDRLPSQAFMGGLVIKEGREVEYDYSLQYVTLPASLRAIGEYAFAYCGLLQIELPQTLTEMGACAFSGCSMLRGRITVPEGVKSLYATFSGCERVTEVEILAPSCKFYGTFDGMYSLKQVKLPEEWSLGDNTFRNCRSLEGEIVMPPPSIGSVDIGANAFFMCTSLTRVVMPGHVYQCGPNTFDYAGLQDVVWPVTMSWGNARLFSFRHCKFRQFFANAFMRWVEPANFAGNELLEEFGLDPSIELRADALAGCKLLRAVYSVGATPPAITGGNPFPDKRADAVLYVPAGAAEAYAAAEYWNTFSQIVELEEFPEWVVSHSRTLQQ